jgi:hypothetical protein
MKKLLFTCLILIAAITGYSQATYYWVGGAGPTSYTSNSNWNTALNGGGTTRTAAAATDILIFDGTNIGGNAPATGTVTATVTSTNSAQVKLQNGAVVNIGRSTAGSAAITINGDGTAADDLVVGAGCTLTLGSPTYNFDVMAVVSANATALISGTVYLSPLSTTVHTRSYITAAGTNNVVFANGSACHITDSTASSGFNGSIVNSVLFKAGSSLYYYTGRSPIGTSSTVQTTNFEPGSNFYVKNSNVSYLDATAYASSSWGNQKVMANIFIQNGSTYKSDGPYYKIENLTVDAGCTFTTHTSGNTPILGNLTVNGAVNGPSGSTNIIVMGGNTPQTISGTGTLDVPSLTVANYSDVTLSRSVAVLNGTNIYGKINFGAANQITGASTFTSRVSTTPITITGTTTAGSYLVSGVTGTLSGLAGLAITGTGIDVNTNIVGFSSGNATINLSKPATASGTATITYFSDTATLVTAHANGMDTLTGSVVVTGTKAFQSGTSYIINGGTTKPFGISTNSTNTYINAGFVEINAPVTVNRGMSLYGHLKVNGKITLRPLDTVRIMSGAYINGAFNSSNYIATIANAGTGDQSVVEYDGLASSATIPIGSATNYLPVTLSPASSSNFTVAVFEGITSQGTINGTPLTTVQKQTVVDAVWNINRISGTGNSGLQLGWVTGLEGSTFTTLANTDIGIIYNTGSSYSLPIGTGDNTANTATATVSNFGAYAVGAVPLTQPFIFNAIPTKIYGAADFNGGATSLNTTQPIVYTSSDPAVATIIGSSIHITGTGTTDITASQASDGFYPAASITRTLTVDKATLTITADNKTKFFNQAVPPLTFTYSAFAYSETPSVLLTPATITTTATAASPVGVYPITVSGATAANYNIVFVNGTLTVQPQQSQTITFNTLPVKTYGNADFAIGATSTNATIPITYVSSNTNVATIVGNNIHIVGAGTSNITASQAGNIGYTPAADITRVLTVNKANLAIKVRDTVKTQGQPNPTFTITYTGFVLGETAANLLTPVAATTTATTTSAPGYYPITLSGATSNNYNITYTNARLTILPLTGTGLQYLNVYMSSSTVMTVRVYSPEPKLGDITIYNMAGQPLKRKNLFMPAGFINNDIYVGNLPSGIYVVTIKGDGVDLQKTVPVIR